MSLISGNPDRYRKEVEQATTKPYWDSARAQLHIATALRLCTKGRRQQVRIKVVDGFPKHFEECIDHPHSDILLRLIHKVFLLKSERNWPRFLRENWDDIAKLIPKLTDMREDRDLPVSDIKHHLFEILNREEERLLESIYRCPHDVLGRYHPASHSIELFWMPISLSALHHGVSILDLAIVVMIHEYAHVYTHIGFDIGGRQWDTVAFNNCGSEIIEGLAQFYTDLVCRQVKSEWPGVWQAYDDLVARQSKKYTNHRRWAHNLPDIAEAVRGAMLVTRNYHISSYQDFMKELTIMMQRLT